MAMRTANELDDIVRLKGAIVQSTFETSTRERWLEDDSESASQRFQGVWQRRKALIVSLFLAIMSITAAVVFFTPKSYESVLKIYIKRDRFETVSMDRDPGTGRAAEDTESEVRSEIEILRSRDLLEKVVLKCHLAAAARGDTGADGRQVALAMQKLEKSLLITPVPKTSILAIRYASPDPKRSAEVLKVLGALYVEKRTALHRSHETAQFFAKETQRRHAELLAAQQRLSQFEQRYGASLLPERKELSLKRVGDLESAIQQVNAQAQDASDRIKVFTEQKRALPATIRTQTRTARNQALLEQLKTELLDLENKRSTLLTKFQPGYRLVTDVEQQIRATKDAIQREEAPVTVDQTDALNPLRQSVEIELSQAQSRMAGFLAQRASLTKDLERTRAQERALEQVTAEYNNLQQQRAISENDYLLYQKKMEEARIADALDKHNFLNVSVLEDPVPAVLPASRHSGFVLLLGLVLAVISSVGSALAMDALDGSVRSSTGFTIQTDIPVLAPVSGGGEVVARASYESSFPNGTSNGGPKRRLNDRHGSE
jgi:uncharacterized protein involved in exopolysaccharide biosynthesis